MEYNIAGEIGTWELPFCNIVVVNPDNDNFISAKAVIDTGAYDYCIKKNIIDSLKLPKVGEGKIALPANGNSDSGIYKANLVFEPNLLFPNALCKVLILEDYPADVIIGTFFLQGKSFHYNTLLKSWRIVW